MADPTDPTQNNPLGGTTNPAPTDPAGSTGGGGPVTPLPTPNDPPITPSSSADPVPNTPVPASVPNPSQVAVSSTLNTSPGSIPGLSENLNTGSSLSNSPAVADVAPAPPPTPAAPVTPSPTPPIPKPPAPPGSSLTGESMGPAWMRTDPAVRSSQDLSPASIPAAPSGGEPVLP